ncbi:MAG: hypothetical protein KZY55_08250 [Paeniclostridium sp.]|nr:hypothetical protein [Paeniclostridium sp.]MBW4863035.1 hypothetical protein [Paeniclostridium sp.]MBW4874042.1 hypothetical protein [Paeniclostridium sp.]
MRINNIDVLITKIDIKEKKDSKEKYLMISFLDMATGDVFEVLEKDLDYLSKIKQMQKYKIDLELSSSKYGLKLEIAEVKENKGSI